VENVWATGTNVDSVRKAIVAAGDSMHVRRDTLAKSLVRRDTLAKTPVKRDTAAKAPGKPDSSAKAPGKRIP
jgi:hypothetical protein